MSTGEHCVTETESCFQTCGNSFIGVLDDNVINATREESEAQCRKVRIMILKIPSLNYSLKVCKATEDCSFYTFFTEDNTVEPKVCILLTG